MSEKLDSDGFQLVKKPKQKSNCSKYNVHLLHNNSQIHSDDLDIDKCLRSIEVCKAEVISSEYYCGFIKTLDESLRELNSPKVSEALCLGLGRFGECSTSRYQLGLLLNLKERFRCKVSVHDPLFLKAECDILKRLNLEVIAENEEGKRKIGEGHLTIVYLPHCPKQLTNNFLWKNWSSKGLHSCLLICNSFARLIESQPRRFLAETVPQITAISPHTKEYDLVNNFKFGDVFNDTSIHIFPEENLPEEFWKDQLEPVIEDCSEFVTAVMKSKLNI